VVASGAFFFVQMLFATTSCTLISGGMAERCRLIGYLFIVTVHAAWIYPGAFAEVGDWEPRSCTRKSSAGALGLGPRWMAARERIHRLCWCVY
jgi:ammonia channel protein AmtB